MFCISASHLFVSTQMKFLTTFCIRYFLIHLVFKKVWIEKWYSKSFKCYSTNERRYVLTCLCIVPFYHNIGAILFFQNLPWTVVFSLSLLFLLDYLEPVKKSNASMFQTYLSYVVLPSHKLLNVIGIFSVRNIVSFDYIDMLTNTHLPLFRSVPLEILHLLRKQLQIGTKTFFSNPSMQHFTKFRIRILIGEIFNLTLSKVLWKPVNRGLLCSIPISLHV